MAEELEGTQAATAVEEPAAASGAPAYTAEELESILGRTVEGITARQYRALQSQIAGDVNAAVKRLESRNAALESLLEKVAMGETVTQEELRATKAEQKAAQLEAEQRQREEYQQAQQQRPPVNAQTAAEQLVLSDYHAPGGIKEQLRDLFEDEGLDFGNDNAPSALRRSIEARQVAVSSENGARNWAAWLRDAKKDLKAAADKQQAATKSAPVVPGAANAGAASSDQALVNKLARSEYMTPAEIAQASAAMARGVFPALTT